MALERFGSLPNGETVWRCDIENTKGMRASILSYGGIIHSLLIPGADGSYADVVLGKDSLGDYLKDSGNSAAVIGRVANRIGGAGFSLNGRDYHLDANDRGNTLHGGSGNYAGRNFTVVEKDANTVRLAVFDNGEGGFPGEVDVTVRYTVTEDNSLEIVYRATASEDTPVNLTNHVYFNLAGHSSGSIDRQTMQIESDFYTPADENVLPTGEIAKVAGTPLDFRFSRPLGEAMQLLEESGSVLGGFDHNFVLRGFGYRRVATAKDPESGRIMETFTDLPGVQLYTANHFPGNRGKEGAVYQKHAGFCLETQFFPDAINNPHFSGCILQREKVYCVKTAYRFSK